MRILRIAILAALLVPAALLVLAAVPVPAAPGGLWLTGGAAAQAADDPIDHCRVCHTTPARLVPAVREAQRAEHAVKQDLPGASVETAGEG